MMALRLGVWLVLVAAALARAAPADDAQQREQLRARIEAERLQIEAAFSAEMAACQQRFVVTACVDEARQRRRDALAAPRAQALLLDDIERRERAIARREAVISKQREAASRPAPPLPASAPLARVRPSPAAASAAQRRNDTGAAAEALRRAQATRERQAEIEAAQERIRARQAERAREGKVAAPLPVPAASR